MEATIIAFKTYTYTNKNTQLILYKKSFSSETKELLNVRTEEKKKSEVNPDSA